MAPWQNQGGEQPQTVTQALVAFGELAGSMSPERLSTRLEAWVARWEDSAELHGLLGLVWLQTANKARALSSLEEALRLGAGGLSAEASFALGVYRAWAVGSGGQLLRAKHLCRALAQGGAPSEALRRLAKEGPRSRAQMLRLRGLRPDAFTLCYLEHV